MASSNACWGIEIGAGAVKAVKVVADGDSLSVADFAYIPHARVLSTPDIDPDDAKRVALGRLVSEYDLSKATVAVSIPGHSSFARFAKLPPVEPNKVPDIVKFEAVQQIPFPLDEVEWDYQTFVSPDSPDVEVGIFAITKQRIASELAILHDVNLTPDVVTLSPVAVYNAIAYDLQFTETSPGTILLDVGTTSTDLIIAEAGRVWVRTFPIGGHEFTSALVESFKLSYPKAEKLKRDAEQSKHARHVFQALRPVFSDLVQDVQRSIGYYQSMHSGVNLERLVGMGSTFQLPGLRKYLKQQLGMNVYRLENFKKLTCEGPRAAEFGAHSLNYATAYGLALQGLGVSALNANLMPLDVAKQAMWAGKGKWFAAAAGISLAATGAMFIRPFMDQQSLNIAEPKSVMEAVSTARTLTNEAKDAGVTDDVTQSEKIAGLMALYEGREVHLQLLGDVDEMLDAAERSARAQGERGAGSGHGFKLQSMHTDYLYGGMTIPALGGGGGRPGGRGNQREEEALLNIPSMGQGREMTEFEMIEMERGGGGGGAAVEDATGAKGPRVAVTLELSTTQPLVEVFVEAEVRRWLEERAEREGKPYYFNIEKFNWVPLYKVTHEEKVDPKAGNTATGGRTFGRPAGGRGGRGVGRRGEFEEEGMGMVPGLSGGEGRRGNERAAFGGGGSGQGNQALPQSTVEAMNTLDQIAPIVEGDESQEYPPDTVESFLRVAFVAVLGEKQAEDDEGGDQ